MITDIIGFILVGVLLTVCLWALYNVPILASGVKDFRKKRQKPHKKSVKEELLPSFSIVVPVKNEESVIDRLLTSLSTLNYPLNKREIIIVEDGSTDKTNDICMNYAKEHANVKILHKNLSNGKPSALNFGLAHAKGDLVAIFDADNVPAHDALLAVIEYFEDPKVAAVQGRTASINPKENMLTQFISYEEAVWCEAYLRGKDVLNLFVHLKGSCQFIRRNILQQLQGFDEAVLSEDMEISARLIENDYKIRYASDVVAFQESPSNLKTLFKQRTRWFRGTMEVAFKYGRLMTKLNRINFDAETTLFGPFILIASLAPYLAAFWAFSTFWSLDMAWRLVVQFGMLTTTLTMLICGLALIYVSKPRKVRSLLWLPFVYCYWSLQAFIALYAMILIVLRRPRVWTKTDKKGVVANSALVLN
ncbi:glycosyltransferase family 2 protein [Candidatus Bathyarchaeota archaeon]|nr:glycosyltransferase family 2 protein [Candidatus Bathyarchaeota archaeon]